MKALNYFLLILVCIFSVLMGGCENYYSNSFIQENKPKSLYYDGVFVSEISEEFKIHNVVVYIVLESNNWIKINKKDNYRVSPYSIWIGLESTSDVQTSVIHSIEIKSKRNKLSRVTFTELPLGLDFETRTKERDGDVKSYRYVNYQFPYEFNFEFADDEVLNISIDIEVFENGEPFRKTLSYDFFPKFEHIFIQNMGV